MKTIKSQQAAYEITELAKFVLWLAYNDKAPKTLLYKHAKRFQEEHEDMDSKFSEEFKKCVEALRNSVIFTHKEREIIQFCVPPESFGKDARKLTSIKVIREKLGFV